MLKLYKKLLCILCMCILLSLSGCNVNNTNSTKSADISNTFSLGYEQILLKYKIMIYGLFSKDFELEFNSNSEKFSSPDPAFEYEWSSMVIDAAQGIDDPNTSSFGYILKDIDSNGIDELFLVRNDYTILAIFTSYNNQPKLLGAYWSRNKCVLLDSGELYILGSSGAQYFEYSIQKIVNQNLEVVKRFGSEGDNYYESINGKIVVIDNIRFEELLSIHPYKAEENNAITKETIIKIQ